MNHTPPAIPWHYPAELPPEDGRYCAWIETPYGIDFSSHENYTVADGWENADECYTFLAWQHLPASGEIVVTTPEWVREQLDTG